jgi:sugar phosphate isomerase/epimerase
MGCALSTSWSAFRYSEGLGLIQEIKSLGFDKVELSFNLTLSMFEDIESLVKNSLIEVTSLHNFCPIPQGLERELALPDHYSLASRDGSQRKKAVLETKRTIDSAVRVKAKAVVLHCGRVELTERTRILIDLYNRGFKDSDEFRGLKKDMIRERGAKAGPHLDNVLKSLDELNEYAGRAGIKLGVETRFYHREIPCFEEIGLILDHFKDSSLFYWHDVGHAEVMERLGLSRQKDFLEAYSGRLLGVHLHNIVGCDDHQAPVKGEFDFKALKPYIKEDTIQVIEAHHPATPEDIKDSKKFLEGLFYGKE